MRKFNKIILNGFEIIKTRKKSFFDSPVKLIKYRLCLLPYRYDAFSTIYLKTNLIK